MKAEKLLERYVKEIHKMPFKNKLKVYVWGVKGKFSEIKGIINFKPPKWDEKEAFIKICDNRIDRLKGSTTEIVTSIGAVIAVLAVFLIRYSEKSYFLILSAFLLISVIVLIFAVLYYKVRMYVWYAIKEGILLVKKEKNDFI